MVTGWVGADLSGAAPHVTRFEPPGPGALLLCSDGLWNYQPEAAKLAGQALPGALTDPLGAAAALVNFALESGGMDNVTVVLIPFPPGPPLDRRAHGASRRSIPRRSPPMSQPDFTVEISQNEYLPEGGDDVNAIVTVTSPTATSEDGGPRRPPPTRAARRSSSSTAPGR